jgi:hypothetical protein
MTGSNEGLEAALEEAVKGTSEPTADVAKEAEVKASEESTGTPEAEVKADPEGKGKPQQVPYSRVEKLSSQKSDLQKALEATEAKLAERDTELSKLVDMLETREYDSKVVEKLNELHEDERYKGMIEKLDLAIRGLDDQDSDPAPKEGETPEQYQERTAKILKDTTSELEAKLEAQRDTIILDRAERLTDRYMDELPETYNQEDRKIIGEALIDKIEWAKIDADPNSLPEVLAEGFQKTIDWYGTPKGSLVAKPQEGEQTQVPAKPDPEAEEKALVDKDWGKLKSVKTPQGETLQPEFTEHDFVGGLAEAIRKASGR